MRRKPVILLAFANDLGHHGRYLKEINREMSELGEILDPHAVVKLKPSASKPIIENAFQDYGKEIKIFHYGGHASGQGIETAPSDDVPRITFAKGLAEFVGRRQGLKLVFLNGCATKEQVQFFHRSQIPCVIATVRPIQDVVARQFAIRFYRSLTKGQNIQNAFADARDSLRGIYPEDRQMLSRNLFPIEEEADEVFPYQLLTDPKHIAVEQEGLKDWTQ
ncbi:MAG: CHAT domain-containing protein, partial [Bacteroidota bacterium]